jgi:hypothetical protein
VGVTDDDVPERSGCVQKRLLFGVRAEARHDPQASGTPERVPDWLRGFDSSQAETIDVRSILRDQGEPFGAVMAIVESLPEHAGLIIEAPFNPLPLRRVLGRMGFATYGERLVSAITPALAPDEHWRIWCAREGKPSERDTSATSVSGAAIWTQADGVHIDVRGLAAPAPLHAILSLIDSGHHEGVIVVHHEREPLFLFPELAERGWTHAIIEGEPGEVRLVLRREPG